MGTPFIEEDLWYWSASTIKNASRAFNWVFYGLKPMEFSKSTRVNDAPSQLALGAAASPGDRFVDVNEDGKIDLDDRTDIGPIPTATMGFNTQFNYKALDFLCIPLLL
jgi:hypothetical protein